MTGIILAAGRSTRTKTPIPKVLLPLGGRPVLDYVLDTCRSAELSRTILVVGWKGDLVRRTFDHSPQELEFAVQEHLRGTADAVLSCRKLLREDEDVVVLSGDVPLLSTTTLRSLIDEHRRDQAVLTLLTAVVENPHGYGRVVRDGHGRIKDIVEEKDATPEQRSICEMNVGLYVFNWGQVIADLERIEPSPVTGEYYLPRLVKLIADRNGRVGSVTTDDTGEFMGINTLDEHRQVEQHLARRRCVP